MQNAKLWYFLMIIVRKADTFILHFAFIILHFKDGGILC